MPRTVPVVFDGEVFRPTEPVDLPPNVRAEVVIPDDRAEQEPARSPRAIQRILDRARAMDLPSDLAAQHDHYLYGTPKR
jgi:hypothetical protein